MNNSHNQDDENAAREPAAWELIGAMLILVLFFALIAHIFKFP